MIIYTIQIKQYGIREGSYVFSSYFQQLSVTTTTTDAFGSKSAVNKVASYTVTPVRQMSAHCSGTPTSFITSIGKHVH